METQIAELERYRYIIENMKDVLWEIDSDFRYTFLSPNVRDMVGYESEEMMGRRMPDFLDHESQRFVLSLAENTLKKRREGSAQAIGLLVVGFVCKDNNHKWVEVSARPVFKEGQFIGYIGTTRDITEKKMYEAQVQKYIEELHVLNEKLEEAANTDSLTGAFSRRKFEEEISATIRGCQKAAAVFSLLFFDIDHFKQINDHYGHKTGDKALAVLSSVIRKKLRPEDSLFRWGGDEFAVILPGTDLKKALDVAEKIGHAVQKKKFESGISLTLSFGVGEYRNNETINQLITRLDTAMLSAKSKGRNSIVIC